MKVLHVLDHSIPLHSGYTFRTMAILQQQNAFGWETVHVTSSKHNAVIQPEGKHEEINGLHFYRTDPDTGLLSKLPIINQFLIAKSLEKRMVEVVKKERPDIIHAHSPALNGLAAVRVGKQFSIPVVYEIRAFWEDAAVDHGTSKEWGLRYRLTRALETYVVKKANHVTTICAGLKKDLLSRGIKEKKITVIPNAVDIVKFAIGGEANPSLIEKYNLSGKTVLGFIGSFYAYEGLPVLLKALNLILRSNDKVTVLLVGGGPDDEKLKQLCNELGLDEHVVFTGRVPHEQVQAYYDLVDIFVYPRMSMRLTDLVTPLKPLEAMAQGKLVIASDVGGHMELIKPGVTGELFAADNVNALADKVHEVIAKKDKWPEMKKAGRSYVETERNWPVSVANYKPVYESLLTP